MTLRLYANEWSQRDIKDSTPPNAHPYRNRRYFYDPEGNHW
jgi:hypothetical protein